MRITNDELSDLIRNSNIEKGLTNEMVVAGTRLDTIKICKRVWWRDVVTKYKLNPKKWYYIYADGEIREERRTNDKKIL